MEAVVWADTAQANVILTGLIAVLIKVCMYVGGLNELWRIDVEGNR